MTRSDRQHQKRHREGPGHCGSSVVLSGRSRTASQPILARWRQQSRGLTGRSLGSPSMSPRIVALLYQHRQPGGSGIHVTRAPETVRRGTTPTSETPAAPSVALPGRHGAVAMVTRLLGPGEAGVYGRRTRRSRLVPSRTARERRSTRLLRGESSSGKRGSTRATPHWAAVEGRVSPLPWHREESASRVSFVALTERAHTFVTHYAWTLCSRR